MLYAFGKYVLFLLRLFHHMEPFPIYVRRTCSEAYLLGYKSLFVLFVASTFMGAVTAVQTAYNLVNPLVPKYIISVLVRDTAILELAPTFMAIVFAGKIGGNIASELGTMRITEQIDALEVMGVNSASYLVLPKILGCVIMFPLLAILSMGFAIVGGYFAGTLTDALTPTEYVYGLRYAFIPYNVTFGLIKAVVFSFLISSISAFTGYYTTGGALEVGRASTNAVTITCVSVLCGDYLLAELLL